MIEILRIFENFSLCKKGRWYYLDNGEDVTEYFDIYTMEEFIGISDREFKEMCESYF